MSFTKHGVAGQSVDLGKSVLTLSALGLFAKLLHIDLGKLQILGVELQPSNASLIPGFLGLALIYAYVCFVVARAEAAIEGEVDKDAIDHRNKNKEKGGLLLLAFLLSPFTLVVYSMPLVFGGCAIYSLWSDSLKVLTAIWGLAY